MFVLGCWFVMQNFVSFLHLSDEERIGYFTFNGLLDIMWLLLIFASFSWCHGLDCVVAFSGNTCNLFFNMPCSLK